MTNQPDPGTCLDILQNINVTLSGKLKESEVIQILLEQAAATINALGSSLDLLGPEEKHLHAVKAIGVAVELRGPEKPIIINDIDQQVLNGETMITSVSIGEQGSQRTIQQVAIPLFIRDHPIGILRLYAETQFEISTDERKLLRILADMSAAAIEKIRLMQSLYRIAEALNSTLGLNTMLERVLSATVREMQLRAASIRLLDKKEQVLRLVSTYGLSESYRSKGEVHIRRSPIDQRVLKGEKLVLYDVATDPGLEYPKELTQEGIKSMLVVPLQLKDRILGVMRVYSAHPRHFSEVGIDFLTSVAGLVALAIENARLYEALQASYEDLKLDLADWYRFLALG